MALRVYYKNRIGYYTNTEKWPDEPARKFKNWMCHANVDLWADMYFYKAKEDYDDFHFFADQMDANIWKAVKILAEAGKKVTIVKSQKKH